MYTHIQREMREIIHVLVQSPNTSQGWARSKTRILECKPGLLYEWQGLSDLSCHPRNTLTRGWNCKLEPDVRPWHCDMQHGILVVKPKNTMQGFFYCFFFDVFSTPVTVSGTQNMNVIKVFFKRVVKHNTVRIWAHFSEVWSCKMNFISQIKLEALLMLVSVGQLMILKVDRKTYGEWSVKAKKPPWIFSLVLSELQQ